MFGRSHKLKSARTINFDKTIFRKHKHNAPITGKLRREREGSRREKSNRVRSMGGNAVVIVGIKREARYDELHYMKSG